MKKIIALGVFMLFANAHAVAETGYYLVSTYENEGEKTIDFKFWSVKIPGLAAVYAPEIGFGYNVTKRWYTELYTTYLHLDGLGTHPNSLTWQNDYLLTQGQYPFDLAIHTNIKRNHDLTHGYGFEVGPVLQTEIGRTQFNGNIFFERTYQTALPSPTQMNYQWQVKYRWHPKLEFGLQGFGELGNWDHWAPHAQQSHRIGPAIFGSLPMGDSQALKYEFAYFTGKVFATGADTFSMRVQYVF